MTALDSFWKLDHLTHPQLLESLGSVLRAKQRALAELVAHLGEVEDRRLHLEAAFGSMFDYCVHRWSMSEDEACRRIDLARLARQFPALFPRLAAGEISLSVALVLKPALTQVNHIELLSAACGKSVREVRELLAARYPRPDVASNIRKLPERRVEPVCSGAAQPLPVAGRGQMDLTSESADREEPTQPTTNVAAAHVARLTASMAGSSPAPASTRARIEPLSARRYKIQFTADATLKEKLEFARDLMRHAHPGGDFAPVVDRALDLLIADLQRRRFGSGPRSNAAAGNRRSRARAMPRTPESRASASEVGSRASTREATVSGLTPANDGAIEEPRSSAATPAPAEEPPSFALALCTSGARPSSPPSSHVPFAARRAVFERDGLACTWTGPDGRRCGSRAWLELDHRCPRSKGGDSDAENLRLLCRAHNLLAAEREYGREHIERAKASRRDRQVTCTREVVLPA